MAKDPLDNCRRQTEQIQWALEGPFADYLKVREALAGPMRQVEEIQRKLDEPGLRAIEQQRAWQETYLRPLRALERAEEFRRLLEGPLAKIQANQELLSRALEGPYAAVLRNQDLVRAAMAAAAEVQIEDDIAQDHSPQGQWLAQVWDQIRAWAPTWEQAETFLGALSALLGLVLYAASEAQVDVPEEDLLEAVGLLCGVGALVIRFAKPKSDE